MRIGYVVSPILIVSSPWVWGQPQNQITKSGRNLEAFKCLVLRVTLRGSSIPGSLLGSSQIIGINFLMRNPRFCSSRATGLHWRCFLRYLKVVCEVVIRKEHSLGLAGIISCSGLVWDFSQSAFLACNSKSNFRHVRLVLAVFLK